MSRGNYQSQSARALDSMAYDLCRYLWEEFDMIDLRDVTAMLIRGFRNVRRSQ